MKPLANQVGQWLGQGATRGVPFEIVCRCGTVSRGRRLPRHQELPCPGCQRPVFILPLSPLGASGASTWLPAPPRKPWPIWLLPAVAGSLTLLVCVLAYFAILHSLVPDTRKVADPSAAIQARVQAGKAALERADFAAAQTELAAARAEMKQAPGSFPAEESRQLHQLADETAVVADWPREPLDLILGRSAKLREDEWQAVANRYLGKGMIFDVIVRRDAAGIFSTTFRKPAAQQLLRLNLQNQDMLKYLPLNEPQRLLLGGRLMELRRDDQGQVQVRLEPDSAVLLTEPAVLKAVAIAVDEAGLADLAVQQRRWVRDLPQK